MVKRYFVILMLWMMAGCAAVGPDYKAPDTQAPAAWDTDLSAGLAPSASRGEDLSAWWTVLNDPVLTELMQRAVAGNLDLRQAESRVRQARAERGVQWAQYFPSVDASGSASLSRSGSGTTTKLYQAGLDASWELDVFGGVRRSVEAADASIGASEADLEDVLVSLLAEVALNYVDLRSVQEQLRVAQDNLSAQSELYDLTRWRAEAGLVSDLDQEQAHYTLEQTRAQIPSLNTGISQARNALCLLLGVQPGALNDVLEIAAPIPVPPQEVVIGLPAEMLRRRPDIRKAERQLAAQTANVGVATADLYPRFTLPGSIGYEALSAGSLFDSSSRTTRIVPGVSWNLFDAGRIRRNIAVQNALQEQALLTYETTVLSALKDVEDALVAYGNETSRLTSLRQASQSAQRAEEMANQQYAAGLVDFQVVLDAQRSLLSIQDQQATSEGQVTANLIRLYKALGGGWSSMAQNSTYDQGVTP